MNVIEIQINRVQRVNSEPVTNIILKLDGTSSKDFVSGNYTAASSARTAAKALRSQLFPLAVIVDNTRKREFRK